jgi:hypothetical protein
MTRIKKYAIATLKVASKNPNTALAALNKIESVLDAETKAEVINDVFNGEM